jgi:hypothetical protein
MLSTTYRIMQSPAVVALLYENGTGRYRQIYMDGRTLPADPNPTWLGYSVGRWEGDTLVVESAGFNDRTWLDRAGHPHSEKLRVTERFRRVDFGHVEYQITFDDPETLTRPLSLSLPVSYQADTDMLENVCNENNRSRLVGAERAGVSVDAAVLARYEGQYAFSAGSRTVAGFMGMNHTVTLVERPALSERASADSSVGHDVRVHGAIAEFFLDANGTVTRLVLGQTEGEAIYTPAPPRAIELERRIAPQRRSSFWHPFFSACRMKLTRYLRPRCDESPTAQKALESSEVAICAVIRNYAGLATRCGQQCVVHQRWMPSAVHPSRFASVASSFTSCREGVRLTV